MLIETEIQTNYPDLYNLLLPLLRNNRMQLSVFLQQVAFNDKINNTETNAHCYFISLDGNNRPRTNDFARFIAEKIVDYSIPRKEIQRALNESILNKTTSPILALNSKARNLFTKLPESGEGGEVILSIMAENFLKLPQIFTKMVLKTSTEMHVHGSDGIHAGTNIDGHLALYWGESKLYSDVASAVRECFSSLSPFLLDAGGSKSSQNRDLQLIRDGIDLNDIKLEEAFKEYLDPENPFFNKLEYRGLCLVGFDSDKYPSIPNTKTIDQLRTEIQQVFNERKSHIEKRVCEEKINTFSIELFLLPFPSVDDFRKSFQIELGINNE